MTGSFPKRQSIDPSEANIVLSVGGSVLPFSVSPSTFTNSVFFHAGPGAPGSIYSWNAFLEEGVYNFDVIGLKTFSLGIFDWAVDGVNIVTGQDWGDSAQFNTLQSNSGISLNGSGSHKLTCTCTGKNVLSGDYGIYLNQIWFCPVSD